MVRKAVFIYLLSFLFIIAENFSRNNASEECGEQNPRNNSCVKAEQKEHCYGKRFFIVTPRSPAVMTAAQNAVSSPPSIATP